MKIYSNQGIELLDIQVDDSSVRYRSIMSDDSLTLKFSHTEPVVVPVGSYVDFEGQRYTLWLPENFKKHNTRNFEYTITLGGWREALKLFKFKDLSAVPYRLKFSLTTKPAGFLQLIVANMNIHDSGWTAGSCIDAVERTLSFNHEYCFDVLARIAQEWSTEFEFVGKKIHLRKVEKFKDAPLPLSYGKGNGFKSGVGRTNDGDKQPIGRLYVQGGERNIDFSTYGSSSLLLPKNQALVVDGKTYRTDAHGMYITRDGNDLVVEDSFDANHIYPKRVGAINEVIVMDAEKHFYDIKDDSIPESLDYSACRIDGEKATISFQSGALAGREFDVEQTDKALTGYIHAERRFKIVPQELDGIVMPGGAFVPKVGDKYAVFNISMPDSYISDNATKTGASWEMFHECVKYFAENEKQKFSFTGELDGIWAKSKWLEIGGKIVPGGHVNFSDTQFLPDGEVVRIVSIKDYVNFPHKPEITLSNAPVSGGFNSTLGKLEAEEVVIEDNRKDNLLYNKRQWRDARETMALLEESLLKFGSGINPITVRTMQLLVGDESLQFRFVTNKTTPTQTAHNVTFDSGNKKLTASAGILQHMTLGINKISPTHQASEYKYWDMEAYTSPPLVADKPYYLYAKCNKSTEAGTFLLSETAIDLEEVAGFYHFLMGVVNSEIDNERSIGLFYGFSEITPGRITAPLLASPDGNMTIDLLNGIITGKIRFQKAGVPINMEDYVDATAIDIMDAEYEAKAYANQKGVELKALTDTYADNAAAAAEQAAGAVAVAKANLAEANAIAHADGIVSVEEQRAIDDAAAKLQQAIAHADALSVTLQAGIDSADAKAQKADYLLAILQEFDDVTIGLILTKLIAAMDGNNVVRSYMSGNPDLNPTAFAAGVRNFGMTNETKNVAINHDGSGWLGNLRYSETGEVYTVDPLTGEKKLIINAQDIPDIADIISSINFGNSTTLSGASLAPPSTGYGYQYMSGYLDVGKDNAEITIAGGASFYFSGVFDNYADYADMELCLMHNDNLVKVVQSIRVSLNSPNNQLLVDTVVIEGLPKGRYKLMLRASISNPLSSASGGIGNTVISWAFQQSKVRRAQLGLNGFMLFYENSHLYFSKERGFSLKGPTDMPGLLASGEVNTNGIQNKMWGAKVSTVNATRNGVGDFTVIHNVGHGKYTIDITPHAWLYQGAYRGMSYGIRSKTSSSFRVYFTDFGGNPQDVTFDYKLSGDNFG